MALKTPLTQNGNKHSAIAAGDKIPGSLVISTQSGNQAIVGSDGALYVPASTAAWLSSMQLNALAYTFTTETGWIYRSNATNATFTLAPAASMPMAAEMRFVNASAATITLSGGTVLSRAGTPITTIAPFGTLWIFRDNSSNWRQSN